MTRGSGEAAGLARLAAVLADETRAMMLLALLDGRAFTAGELAARSGVAASTATEHLDRLVAAGLVVHRRQGRHRYVQLADSQTATMLEDLAARAPAVDRPQRTMRAASLRAALARGRTCYDHLAGQLGVAITDAMVAARLLDRSTGFGLTAEGRAWLVDRLGAEPAVLRATQRPVARPCLDWTERRDHLGGSAGAALCSRLLDQGWVERYGTSRAVRVTTTGTAALRGLLGLDVAG